MEEKKADKENSTLNVQMANDQRSTVFSPVSPAFKEALDNRSRQLNPNNRAYHSSRSGSHKK